jgi:prepilin-type processing-associated H-X9-DG protein
MKWGGVEINTERLKAANNGATIEYRMAQLEASSGGGGGGNVIPAPPITGLYYMTTANMNFADGHSLWANELTFNPFRPMNNLNVNQFNIEVTMAQAGQNVRVVIYSDRNGKPGSKLYESTNISIATTGYKTVTMSFNFTAGTLYWVGVQGSGNSGRLRAVLNTNSMLAWSVSATASTAYSTLIYTSLIFGSLPETIPPATAIYQGSAGPFVLKFRAA